MAINVFFCEGSDGAIIALHQGEDASGIPSDYDESDVSGGYGVSRGADGDAVADETVLDDLSAPNGRWLSKPYTPEGESGICYFRRLYFTIRHNAGFVFHLRPYVNGSVLLEKDGTTKQDVVVQRDAPTFDASAVEYIEIAIAGRGTNIQWLMQTGTNSDSDNTPGEFIVEGAAIGYLAERGAILDTPED